MAKFHITFSMPFSWYTNFLRIHCFIPISFRYKCKGFLCPPWPRPTGDIERSGCPYISPYIHPSEDQVKIFVQGRISRSINGSKLIFHMMMYLYETSRNIQKPWPHDLYFAVHLLRTLARLSRLRYLSKVESQDLLMVASWYFTWGCISMRSAGKYMSHDLLTYISRSADCKLQPIFHG